MTGLVPMTDVISGLFVMRRPSEWTASCSADPSHLLIERACVAIADEISRHQSYQGLDLCGLVVTRDLDEVEELVLRHVHDLRPRHLTLAKTLAMLLERSIIGGDSDVAESRGIRLRHLQRVPHAVNQTQRLKPHLSPAKPHLEDANATVDLVSKVHEMSSQCMPARY